MNLLFAIIVKRMIERDVVDIKAEQQAHPVLPGRNHVSSDEYPREGRIVSSNGIDFEVEFVVDNSDYEDPCTEERVTFDSLERWKRSYTRQYITSWAEKGKKVGIL